MSEKEICTMYEAADFPPCGKELLEEALEEVARFIPQELFDRIAMKFIDAIAEAEYGGFENGVKMGLAA